MSTPDAATVGFVSSLSTITRARGPTFSIIPIFEPFVPSCLLADLFILLDSILPFLEWSDRVIRWLWVGSYFDASLTVATGS